MQRFILPLLFICATIVNAQVLSHQELEEDLNYLQKKIVNWYPGLGYYTPLENYTSYQDSLLLNLPDSMNYPAFYRRVTSLVSQHKDGHISAWHRKKYSDKTTRFLPLHVREADSKYFVVFNVSPDSSLCRGDELLSIDGEPVKELHDLFADRFRTGADSDIPTGRYYRNLVSFSSSYFNWFGEKDSVQIRYVPAVGTDTLSRYLTCQISSEALKILKKRYAKDLSDNTNLRLSELDSSGTTAVLNVSTFSKFKKKDPLNLKYKKKLKAAFKTIQEKGYDNLVIDLRGNGGGSIQNSGRLLSYLLPEPFSVMSGSTLRPKAVWPYITMDLNPFMPLGFLVSYRWDKEAGVWRTRTSKRKDFKPDKTYPFRGNLYFLTNGASYSATVSVLAHAKNQGVGTIVGEVPGGAYWGDFAGRFKIITLPNSKIRVRIPLKTLYHDVAPSDSLEIQPNHPIARTYEDIITPGRDFGIEYVRKLITTGK